MIRNGDFFGMKPSWGCTVDDDGQNELQRAKPEIAGGRICEHPTVVSPPLKWGIGVIPIGLDGNDFCSIDAQQHPIDQGAIMITLCDELRTSS
jgi:hypothetical protein